MATDKKSFVAYCDWLESFEELSDEEAGKLVKHLFRYVNDTNPEAPDKLTKMCFIPIQQSLKRDLRKYEAYIEKQSENGSKGGRPPKPKEPKEPTALIENPTEPKKADSVSVNVSVSVNDTVNDKEETDLSLPDPFEKFWNLGLPRVEKRKCQNEWLNIDAPEYPKILEHLPKFIKGSAKYLANPLTYLEGRLWQDEDLPNYADKSKVKNTTVLVVPSDGYGKNSWDEWTETIK